LARRVLLEPSRTLMEFRLLPRLTTRKSSIDDISLKTPFVHDHDTGTEVAINIPLTASAMQSVSGDRMAIELAKLGGTAFIYCSQLIESQAAMVANVKKHKAGFVEPRTVNPALKIGGLIELSNKTGYSAFPVVDREGIFLGLITRHDFDPRGHTELAVADRMIPREDLEVGVELTDLKVANSLLVESHQPILPIVDSKGKLCHLVFRKDIQDHLNNPLQLVDEAKRLMASAAINTHDYKERAPALIDAGVDVLAIDSSDGLSVYQKETLEWLRSEFPKVPVIAGNVITGEGFDFLVESGAGGVKVGMGGGSICITQEQKGTGRGLATAIMDVVRARETYLEETGIHIPIIADGGIINAKDIVIALALGADSVMMGRFFARMEESPTEKVVIDNKVMKPYWGEGSRRAREWRSIRYSHASFVEGVEGLVEYAGKLRDNLGETLNKIRAAMSSCGVATIEELHDEAELELISALSIREGQVHDIILPGREGRYRSGGWGD
jgi:IMP dehydrogenase